METREHITEHNLTHDPDGPKRPRELRRPRAKSRWALILSTLALAATVLSLDLSGTALAAPNAPNDPDSVETCLAYPVDASFANRTVASTPLLWDYQAVGMWVSSTQQWTNNYIADSPPNVFLQSNPVDIAADTLVAYYAGVATDPWSLPPLEDVSAPAPTGSFMTFDHENLTGTRVLCAEYHYVFVDPTNLNVDNDVLTIDAQRSLVYPNPAYSIFPAATLWARSLYYVGNWNTLTDCLQSTPTPVAGTFNNEAELGATDAGYCFTVFADFSNQWPAFVTEHLPNGPVDPTPTPTPTPTATPAPWTPPTDIQYNLDYNERNSDLTDWGTTQDPLGNFYCNGQRATIVGTEGDDVLRGTSDADVIVGLGGNDRIYGNRNNDLLCGGPGNDRISGGWQSDFIHGEAGNDTITGNPGHDVLVGGPGEDVIGGGAQSDRIHGGAGDDLLEGKDGSDSIYAGAGDDESHGDSHDDYIEGGPGSDWAHGGTEPFAGNLNECAGDNETQIKCD